MLMCDGYKMFHGSATVTPVNGNQPYTMTGTWLYNPERRYWYCERDNARLRIAVGVAKELVSDIKEDVA